MLYFRSRNRQPEGSRQTAPCLFIAMLALAFIAYALPSAAQTFGTQLLTDPGLNSDSQPLLPFTQPILDRWMQEDAILVTGVQADGVGPFEGDGMLALSQTGGFASQVRQRIDVSSLAQEIDLGLVTAVASGRVNASVAGTTGGSQVTAYDAAQSTIGVVAGLIALNGDPSAWEPTSASLMLPIGTRFVEHEFQFPNSTLPPGETGYGDAAGLVLEIQFDGLFHTPLGNAQLSVDDTTGFLLVSNIGSTGEDGVAIELGEADGWTGEFFPHGIAPFGGDPLPQDATMSWEIFGNQAEGGPSQLLTTGWWDVTGPNEMTWSASTPDATGYLIEVVDTNGTLLHQAEVSDDDGDGVVELFTTANSCHDPPVWDVFNTLDALDIFCALGFEANLAGPLVVDGTLVPTGDGHFYVRIVALGDAKVHAMTRLEIKGANLPLFDNEGVPLLSFRNEALRAFFGDGFESGDTSAWSSTAARNNVRRHRVREPE